MRKLSKLILCFFSFVSLGQNGEQIENPDLYSGRSVNSLGSVFKTGKIKRSNFFFIESPKAKKIKIKYPELKWATNTVSIGEDFFFLNRDNKDFQDIEYSLVMVNSRGQNPIKTSIIKAHEKGSRFKSGPSPGSVQLAFEWGAQILKSENEKYIAVAVSKGINSNYYELSRYSDEKIYKRYGQQTEKFYMGVIDNKLNVVRKGTYDFGILRNEINYTVQHIDNNGNYFIFVKKVQVFKNKSSEAYLIKISPNDEPVTKKINLENYNLTHDNVVFKGDSMFFYSAVKDLEKGKIRGLYSGIVNLKNLEIDGFVSKFSQEYIDWFNERHGYKKGLEHVVKLNPSSLKNNYEGDLLYYRHFGSKDRIVDDVQLYKAQDLYVLKLDFSSKKIKTIPVKNLNAKSLGNSSRVGCTAFDGDFYFMASGSDENPDMTFPIVYKLEDDKLKIFHQIKGINGAKKTEFFERFSYNEKKECFEFKYFTFNPKQPKKSKEKEYAYYRYYINK